MWVKMTLCNQYHVLMLQRWQARALREECQRALNRLCCIVCNKLHACVHRVDVCLPWTTATDTLSGCVVQSDWWWGSNHKSLSCVCGCQTAQDVSVCMLLVSVQISADSWFVSCVHRFKELTPGLPASEVSTCMPSSLIGVDGFTACMHARHQHLIWLKAIHNNTWNGTYYQYMNQ